MQRISSSMTFVSKRVFPFIWFGFLGLFVAVALTASIAKGKPPLVFLIVPAAMAVFGYFLMKALVFDLMDEVWDAGNELVVRNKGEEARIPLSEIMNISYSVVTSPPRVTLMLRHPCRFGAEITFSPPSSFVPFRKNPIVDDLIQRVDGARRT